MKVIRVITYLALLTVWFALAVRENRADIISFTNPVAFQSVLTAAGRTDSAVLFTGPGVVPGGTTITGRIQNTGRARRLQLHANAVRL